MIQAVKKYRKRLEKRLCCGHEARKRLLGQFNGITPVSESDQLALYQRSGAVVDALIKTQEK